MDAVDTKYELEIENAIQDVVKARTKDDRFDAKNALIALVDDRANGNKRLRAALMARVETQLGEAYLAL